MTDTLTKDQRRRVMQANRGRTKLERRFAAALWRRGLRYLTHEGYGRRYGVTLLGKPDMVFHGGRVLVFVDGCFWHGCPDCRGIPTQSGEYWRAKITRNVERDRRITAELERLDWKVIRVWEHEIRRHGDLEAAADELAVCIGEW